MAKKSKKPKTIPVKDPKRRTFVRKLVLHSLAAMVFIGLLAAGFYKLRQYVERDIVFPDQPPRVVLKNRPIWMSDALALQIINSIRPRGAHSAFDQRLLTGTVAILEHNPWIKHVRQVRRVYGQAPGDTLEVDCDYRAPIALVHWKDFFWLVDGEGTKLPEQFTAEQLPAIVVGQDRRLNIRIIEGVIEPPVESGQRWMGDDLAAGLDLVKILYGQDYAEEIVKVDVTNFAGRIDPREAQIIFVTKYNTEVRWGRPIDAKDFLVEVAPAQKIQTLQNVWAQYHRVDAGQAWIDIRFDRPTYPSDPTARLDGTR